MSNLDSILLGRFASLESDVPAAGGVADALEIGQVVDEDGAQLDGENLVEGDLIAAADDAEVIDEGATETNELIETTEALESYLAAAKLARKQGGWTTQEATAYHLGIDLTMKKLGGDASAIVPSLESFGTSRERLNATASVENRLTEALKKIWDAIKRAVNKVYVFVKKWYLKILDGASRLKKRAEAIRKKAENTSGSKKENKVRTGVFGQLYLENKGKPNAEALKDAIEAIATLVGELTDNRLTGNYGTKCGDIIDNIQAIADNDATKTSGTIAAISGALSEIAKGGTFGETKAAGSTEAKRVFPGYAGAMKLLKHGSAVTFPGGKWIATTDYDGVSGNDDKAAAETAAKQLKYGFKIVVTSYSDKKVEIDESTELDVLDQGGVISICDAVITFADKVIDYKKGFEQYQRKTDELLKKADKIKSKDSKSDDGDPAVMAAIARSLATGVGAAMRNMGQSITNVINYGMNLSRAALVYGNSSLNQYKD